MPVTAVCGERRLEPRHAAVSFQRLDQSGLLAAYKSSRAGLDPHIAGKITAQDIFAEFACFTGLFDRVLQAHDRKRIFSTDVHDRFRRADRIGRDHHTLDQTMRIGLDNGTVHERAGVAFVRVADQVFRPACGIARGLPFEPGRETRSAAARKPGDLDFLDDLFRRHGPKHLFKGLISVIGHIIVNVSRIDHAAVAQRDPCLFAQEILVLFADRDTVHQGQISALDRSGNIVRILRCDMHKPLRQHFSIIQINNGLEPTHTDASGDPQARALYSFKFSLQRFINLAGTRGQSAAALSDDNSHPCTSLARISRIMDKALSGVSEP